MFKHSELRRFSYTPRQLFDFVAAVEKYPEFIDGFVSATIRRRNGNVLEVDQVVRLAGLRVAFTTQAVLDPPRQITISTTDFPFRSFDQRWTFTPEAGGTMVRYDIGLELRFGGLQRLMGMVVDERALAEATVEAFRRRARQIYGDEVPTALPA
jgi:coenzyme Q-binding protein COQ10